jgi:hypothetical protein
MPDTPTPETPAELAAKARAYLLPYRHAPQDMLPELRDEFHAIIDRLESLATLAASRTTPHRWLFTDEHGLECVTTLDPSLWNARSRNSRTNVTPLYAAPAPAAAERKPLTVREILAATCRITVTEFPEARDYDIAVARATERAHGIS